MESRDNEVRDRNRAPRSTGESQPPVEPVPRDTVSWVNWQSALYAFVLGAACLVLAPLTNLWWIVPVLGALVPLALAVLGRADLKPLGTSGRKLKERELLEALSERGELTPATAAMLTSLTVDEASRMLDELASKGYLVVQAEDGVMSYALRQRDRLEEPGGEAVVKELDEPLSGRELEVLNLLAAGKTNAEIARALFISVGTVKSHTNSIYRKLGAKNRTGALARARDLGLI